MKSAYGWDPMPFTWAKGGAETAPEAAVMILRRSLPLGGFSARLSVLYAPKGPNLDWGNTPLRKKVIDDLQSFARRQGAVFLKIDPDIVLGTGIPGGDDSVENQKGQTVGADLVERGWMYSLDQIQFRNTVIVDLKASEDDLLASMKQKTRYNIRLASRKDVTVRVGGLSDLPALYRMYAQTSARDGFVIRPEEYYHLVWSSFMQSQDPYAEPLIAEVDGQPVAAVFIFRFSGRAYYFYGMSLDRHRDKMPNHLLQWEAMRRAKQAGCTAYDLWGAPDEFMATDPLWGVYRFKEGFGGTLIRTLGAWDYAPNRLWYQLYTNLIPRVLNLMRRRGQSMTRASLGNS